MKNSFKTLCNVDEGDPTQASESRIKTNEFIKIDRDLKL